MKNGIAHFKHMYLEGEKQELHIAYAFCRNFHPSNINYGFWPNFHPTTIHYEFWSNFRPNTIHIHSI